MRRRRWCASLESSMWLTGRGWGPRFRLWDEGCCVDWPWFLLVCRAVCMVGGYPWSHWYYVCIMEFLFALANEELVVWYMLIAVGIVACGTYPVRTIVRLSLHSLLDISLIRQRDPIPFRLLFFVHDLAPPLSNPDPSSTKGKPFFPLELIIYPKTLPIVIYLSPKQVGQV